MTVDVFCLHPIFQVKHSSRLQSDGFLLSLAEISACHIAVSKASFTFDCMEHVIKYKLFDNFTAKKKNNHIINVSDCIRYHNVCASEVICGFNRNKMKTLRNIFFGTATLYW